ncbi:MAG: Glycosyltransferase [Microgenomates group bacterium Gr01-1014_16]|nr:MAG: Glycosyltransferase [Microgenomates group bacterium Gr01-1014_16]
MPSKRIDLALAYIYKMTDETGLIEHAKFSEPNKAEGYSTDDNARAYQAMLSLGRPRRNVYLDFLKRAVGKDGFHNDMDEGGEWIDEPGLGEWFGRAMVAVDLGIKIGDPKEKGECRRIWDKAKPAFTQVTSRRTMAQLALAGVPQMADKLVAVWEENRTDDWEWFEEGLYYDNARLPHALLTAGKIIPGKITLDWLINKLWDEKMNCFSFVGQAGWWRKGEPKAEFDQQPVEAGGMVEACMAAYRATKDKKYLDWANMAYEWYFGRNIIKESLVDEKTGSIRDGFNSLECSLNEGAEAVLSFVLASINLMENEIS